VRSLAGLARALDTDFIALAILALVRAWSCCFVCFVEVFGRWNISFHGFCSVHVFCWLERTRCSSFVVSVSAHRFQTCFWRLYDFVHPHILG